MKQQNRDNFYSLVLAILLSFLTYNLVLAQLPGNLSDFNGHTYVYLPLFARETWIQGWMTVPYCMWHLIVMFLNRIMLIPLEVSAAYTACFFNMFAYFVFYWMILKVTAAAGREESPLKAALVAFGLCVVQSIHLWWWDLGDGFLGTYSMNPFHNPTQMCVRGFGLLCFCLVYDIWQRQKDESYRGLFFQVERGLKRYYVCLAVMLFLSAMAKPTFAEMFIPAVALIMLGEWIARLVRKDGSAAPYFKHCLSMLWCSLPTLGYILLQFCAYFLWGGSYGNGGSLIVTEWLQVWHFFTENVGLSILVAMAFPLFMVLIDPPFFVKNDMGRLALTGYGIGFLEAALLGESGEKLSHSDFIWPMMSGMLLMWAVSAMRLLVLERTRADTGLKRNLLSGAWMIFLLHVLCGLFYIAECTQ